MTGLRALAAVAANPALRRLELAWLGSIAGEFAYAVALAVYAYDAGGAAAVGIVWLLRMIPAAVGAPFAAVVADRYPRERVMLSANVLRAVAAAATAAAVAAGAPDALVYAGGILVAVLSTVFWPAQAALLPAVARTPEELTAANTASTTLEGLGSFAGPALCAALLAATGTAAAFATVAAVFVLAGLPLVAVRGARAKAPGTPRRVLADLGAGLRAAAAPGVRVLVGVYAAWALVTGALTVLVVVSAYELLGWGEAGVGALNAAIGLGAVAGAIATAVLVGSRRLGRWLSLALVLWSAPIALLAAVDDRAPALALLAALGGATILVDTTALTLTQRVAAESGLMRVLGVVEGLWVGLVGVGAAGAGALVAAAGARPAFLAAAGVLPALVVLAWKPLRALDRVRPPSRPELELLRRVPFLAAAEPPVLERLAARATRIRAAAGTDVVRAGERGDRFYVIERGEALVTANGPPRRLAEGDWFGEIALIHAVPRTATVTAASELELLALDRADFLRAVAVGPLAAIRPSL